MQRINKNNILQILTFFLIGGIFATESRAQEQLQLFYSNDVRSELEACG